MPEIVKGGEVAGFDQYHPVIGRPPDMGVFSDYGHVFGGSLFELVPFNFGLILISLSQGSDSVKD